jgi:hypothetical protein
MRMRRRQTPSASGETHDHHALPLRHVVRDLADCRKVWRKVFVGALSGPNESPPNASSGVGYAVVTYDPDTAMMRVQATFSNLSTADTAAHIHCCFVLPATTAGVATVLPTFTGFPSGVTAGAYDHTFDMSLAGSYNPAFVTARGSISAALDALVQGMTNGTAYFNIHTTLYPAGEIRSNLAPDTIFASNFE